MPNLRGIAAVVVAWLVVGSSAFAGGNDVRYTRSSQAAPAAPGRHAKLGLMVGGLGGLVVGGVLALGMGLDDEPGHSGAAVIGVFAGCTVGGALAGYAIGGGFADRADQALDLGRERVREAEVAAAQRDEALPKLRMANVAGFEQLALVEDDRGEPMHLASLR